MRNRLLEKSLGALPRFEKIEHFDLEVLESALKYYIASRGPGKPRAPEIGAARNMLREIREEMRNIETEWGEKSR